MKLIIKNYNKSPFFYLVWILVGSLLGALTVQDNRQLAIRLLFVIIGLIILNGLFSLLIGYMENSGGE